jgi:hypothetical protein
MAKNKTTGSRAKNTAHQLRSHKPQQGCNLLNGRLRLLFIASPRACLFTSLLAVYRPPSCIPLSVLNFLAFRLRSTVARVSRKTNMTMGRYTPKVTDCQLNLQQRIEGDVLIWNHWIQRHSKRGSASTHENMTGAKPGPIVTQKVKIDMGNPRLNRQSGS